MDMKLIPEELCTEKRKEFLERKRRQQLHQNHEELRELERQLRAAHISNQLSKQRAGILQRKEFDIQFKKKENDEIKAEELHTQNVILKEKFQKDTQKKHFRIALLDQIAEQKEHRHLKFADLMRDSENTANLLKQIAQERALEKEELQQKKMKSLYEMQEVIRNQEILKLQKKVEARREDEIIAKIRDKTQNLAKRQKEIQRKKKEEKEALIEELGRQTYNIECKRRHREQLLNELRIEERKAKEDLQFRMNIEKQLRAKISFQNECEKHRCDAINLKKLEQKDELYFREKQMKYLAERDKIEQLTKEKRRLKQIEHRRAVQEMILDKKAQRAKEAADKVYQHSILDEVFKKEQREINEERLRMLSREPKEVLRFLPGDVLNATKNLLSAEQ